MAAWVLYEDFVVSWMIVRDIDGIMKDIFMLKAAIKARGVMLRGKGVKLPRLSPPATLDALRIAQLNSLVNKYKK